LILTIIEHKEPCSLPKAPIGFPVLFGKKHSRRMGASANERQRLVIEAIRLGNAFTLHTEKS
ncbi:hypothetical protein, partial [Enorma massiliensis]|uniref:hypothetical protein n=1 Tax=Enorma massiliensis TaxID=1472761 RepID=UPI003A8E6E3D